jgi:hypothetical protein
MAMDAPLIMDAGRFDVQVTASMKLVVAAMAKEANGGNARLFAQQKSMNWWR